MYKKPTRVRHGGLTRVNVTEGTPIERKIEAMMKNNEIKGEKGKVPLMYFPAKDGVRAETNVRTDKWDVAQNLADIASKTRAAKKEDAIKKAQKQAEGSTDPKKDNTDGSQDDPGNKK